MSSVVVMAVVGGVVVLVGCVLVEVGEGLEGFHRFDEGERYVVRIVFIVIVVIVVVSVVVWTGGHGACCDY